MKRSAFLLVPILFLATAAVSQSNEASTPSSQSVGSTADLTQDQKAKVKQLAQLQRSFGKGMNSSGVELSLKERSRSRTSNRTLVDYDLYAAGLPKNTTYSLFQVQMDGSKIKNLGGITLDAHGRAICAGREGTCEGNGPNDPIGLTVYAARGEAKRFVFISEDEAHLKGFISVIPFPNAAMDKNCRLESVLGSKNGELTFIQASGFEPNSELTIDGQSYDEKKHYTAKAEANGSYFAALMPYVAGKKTGKTIFEIKGNHCNPKLTFQWGDNSYHLQ